METFLWPLEDASHFISNALDELIKQDKVKQREDQKDVNIFLHFLYFFKFLFIFFGRVGIGGCRSYQHRVLERCINICRAEVRARL